MTVVKPADAASLIIYRRETGAMLVLMGKRRRQAKFAPNVYVFPGGRLDSADSKLDLDLSFERDGVAPGAIAKIQDLANTAIRETWEETGLLLAEKGQLNTIEHPTWAEFHRMGFVPAVHRLSYLGRAITPSSSSTRFHARFFAAPFEFFIGTLLDEGELLDLRWVPIDQAMNLPMWDVTEFMLAELQKFLKGPRSSTPLMSYRGNQSVIRYE